MRRHDAITVRMEAVATKLDKTQMSTNSDAAEVVTTLHGIRSLLNTLPAETVQLTANRFTAQLTSLVTDHFANNADGK